MQPLRNRGKYSEAKINQVWLDSMIFETFSTYMILSFSDSMKWGKKK